MASWFDLKGTFQNTFRLGGKAKTKLDANAPTVSRDFIFPDANVDLSGGTNGQFLSKLSATTIGWASGGGGGGYTEIANAGNISGSYDGNVYCAGTVTLTGNVTVKGSILAEGKVTNTGGYSLTVKGDCIFKGEVDFQTNNGIAPGNISIDGNFYTGERSTPYPLYSIDDPTVTLFNNYAVTAPIVTTAGSGTGEGYTVVSFLNYSSDDYFEIAGDYSFFPGAAEVLIIGGPNNGLAASIISMTFNGVSGNTEIFVTPLGTNFNGSESGIQFNPFTVFRSTYDYTSFAGINFTVTTGANAGNVYQFGFPVSFVDPNSFTFFYVYSITPFASNAIDSFAFELYAYPISNS
jgi:hypothetical protein